MGKKKEVINHEHERLWEELTLDRTTKSGDGPPYGGYGGNNAHHSGHSWSAPTQTVVYHNKEGRLHRIYGPAYLSRKYRIEKWYKEGELHRIGGPALSHKNTFLWYKEGKLHNLEGPAVIDPAGPNQYWIEGSRMTEKEYKKQIESKKRKGLIK